MYPRAQIGKHETDDDAQIFEGWRRQQLHTYFTYAMTVFSIADVSASAQHKGAPAQADQHLQWYMDVDMHLLN